MLSASGDPDGYVIYFGEWTFQNWQSEFLEVLLLIVLTKYLVHKGNPKIARQL